MITWDEVRKSQETARMNWKLQRNTQYRASEQPLEREKPLARELPPPRLVQGELEGVVGEIDDREAFIRHKQALALRWFQYYKQNKDPKKKWDLVRQYNMVAAQRQKQ